MSGTTTIKNLDYFYDGQIRRYLEQIVRVFSGWQYQTGGTTPTIVMVPCLMSQSSSMVANIINNNSQNALQTTPMISVTLTNLRGRREEVQNPNLVDSRQVVEREIVNGAYTGNRGNSYTVDRIMPMPFEMSIQVDIWTSNLDQKMQLMEQILTVIYPGFDIQNSTNALDWTALTTVYVEDIVWTTRTIPIGANTGELEIGSIQLKIPFWLTAPAKVKRQTLIQQIITNVYSASKTSGNGSLVTNAGIDVGVADGLAEGAELIQVVTTPGNYAINVASGVITLIPQNNETLDWFSLINEYGTLKPTVSQLRLYDTPDFDKNSTYISGTIQLGSQPNELLWQITPNTLPANTLEAVTAVINPSKTSPGNNLNSPQTGSYYLILGDIVPCLAWGNLTASAQDIITYNGTSWSVSFDASTNTETQYVLNSYTGTQLKFDLTSKQWVLSVDRTYEKGYWELVL